jgi:hypothetical protein
VPLSWLSPSSVSWFPSAGYSFLWPWFPPCGGLHRVDATTTYGGIADSLRLAYSLHEAYPSRGSTTSGPDSVVRPRSVPSFGRWLTVEHGDRKVASAPPIRACAAVQDCDETQATRDGRPYPSKPLNALINRARATAGRYHDQGPVRALRSNRLFGGAS